MTFKADRPVGRYYIVPNSLVVGYDKTIVSETGTLIPYSHFPTAENFWFPTATVLNPRSTPAGSSTKRTLSWLRRAKVLGRIITTSLSSAWSLCVVAHIALRS